MQKFNFVDLGLPSGRKWADANVDGFFSWDEAIKVFGNKVSSRTCKVPSKIDWKELVDNCNFEWDEDRKVAVFTGPNGRSISLPAEGCLWPKLALVGHCNYLSSTLHDGAPDEFVWHFYIHRDGWIGPGYTRRRNHRFSVRTVSI